LDDGDFDDGSDTGGDAGSYEPADDTTSRSDVEEAVISQRAARGDPDPRRHDYGSQRGELRGRADAAVGGNYEGLQHYHDEAVRNGTSLQNAIRDYAQVESDILRNPVTGVVSALHRMGLDARQIIGAAAQHLYGPNGNQAMAQAARQAQYDHHVRSIEQFKADPGNKYFDHVRLDMARLVQSGRARDLKSAYRMAIAMHPQLRVMAKMDRLDARRDRDRKRARGFSTYGGY
jgi:hypothetical protein